MKTKFNLNLRKRFMMFFVFAKKFVSKRYFVQKRMAKP